MSRAAFFIVCLFFLGAWGGSAGGGLGGGHAQGTYEGENRTSQIAGPPAINEMTCAQAQAYGNRHGFVYQREDDQFLEMRFIPYNKPSTPCNRMAHEVLVPYVLTSGADDQSCVVGWYCRESSR